MVLRPALRQLPLRAVQPAAARAHRPHDHDIFPSVGVLLVYLGVALVIVVGIPLLLSAVFGLNFIAGLGIIVAAALVVPFLVLLIKGWFFGGV